MTAVQTKQAQATETECLALVKHLTRTSISVLSYLRELFPEDAFEERNVSGKLGVKLLRRGIDDGADQLLDVLERGVFDALEKKYLKTLVIGVSVDGDKPDTLVESYIFQFTYPNDTPTLGISHSVGDKQRKLADGVSVKSKDQITQATTATLRKMIVLTQSLEPLPQSDRLLSFKIDYHPHTPDSYEPPLFRPPSSESESAFAYDGEMAKLGLCELETGKYDVKARIRVQKEAFEVEGVEMEQDEADDPLQTDLEVLSQATAETQAIQRAPLPRGVTITGSQAEIGGLVKGGEELLRPARQRLAEMKSGGGMVGAPDSQNSDDTQALLTTLARSNRSKDVSDTFAQLNIGSQSQAKSKSKNGGGQTFPAFGKAPHSGANSAGSHKSGESDESSLKADQIDCICGYSKSDGPMIECDFCGKFSHLPCAGYPSPDSPNIPTRFKCTSCRDAEGDDFDQEEMRTRALLRRTLVMIKENGLISMRKTGAALGGDVELGKFVIRRLREQGFVKAIEKGGYINKHVLVPWKKTEKMFEEHFQPGNVWIWEDGRQVTHDPNADLDPDTDAMDTSSDARRTSTPSRPAPPKQPTFTSPAPPPRKRTRDDPDSLMAETAEVLRTAVLAAESQDELGHANKRRRVSVAVTRIKVAAPEGGSDDE